MPSTQSSSSSAPISDEDYLAVVSEFEVLTEEVSETEMLEKILEAYKNVSFETMDFYLSCHQFGKVIRGLLRKMYTNCHQRWNQQHGKNEELIMPYPIRDGKIDAEEKKNHALNKLSVYKQKNPLFKINYDAVEMVTKMNKKQIEASINGRKDTNWHPKTHVQPNLGAFHLKYDKDTKVTSITFMSSYLPKRLVELLKMLVSDNTFKDYMEPADDYIANINEAERNDEIKECEVLLQFLVLVRRGEGFKMFDLVANNQFPIPNQQGMRRLYGKGYQKFVRDNKLRRNRHDPAPWPINIMVKKPATEEENEILEEELRKKLDNACSRSNNREVAMRTTTKSADAVKVFLRERYHEEKHLSRAKQNLLRKKRLEDLRRHATEQIILRERFRAKNLAFFEAYERMMGIEVVQTGKTRKYREPRESAEKTTRRTKADLEKRYKSKKVVESSESESEEEAIDNDANSDEESGSFSGQGAQRRGEFDSSESEAEEHTKDDEQDDESDDCLSSADEDDEPLASSGTQNGGESTTAIVKPAAARPGRPRKQVTEEPAVRVKPAVVRRPLRPRKQRVETIEPALDGHGATEMHDESFVRASEDTHYESDHLPEEMPDEMTPLGEHMADDQLMALNAEAHQGIEQNAFVDGEQRVEQEEREHEVVRKVIIVPLAKTKEYKNWLGAFLKEGEEFDSLSCAHVEMARPIKEEAGEGIQVIVQSEPNPMVREMRSFLDSITEDEAAGPSRKRRHNQDSLPLAKEPKLEEPEEEQMAPVVPVAAEPVVSPAEPLLVPKEEIVDD